MLSTVERNVVVALSLECLEETVYQEAVWLPSGWELGSGLVLMIARPCGWFGHETASVGSERMVKNWLSSAVRIPPSLSHRHSSASAFLSSFEPDSSYLISMASSQATSCCPLLTAVPIFSLTRLSTQGSCYRPALFNSGHVSYVFISRCTDWFWVST